ncbi:MAG TPA: hypothetical protein VLB68_01425 [Pyrinomonadaceae bacterium]|nr:hypothetical protein [Pyrinomonadaceae bacterium]
MNSDGLQNRVGIAFLVFSMLIGIGLVMSSAVQAQGQDDRYAGERRSSDGHQNQRGRNWELYGNYGGSTELRQTALNAGYNEGISEARRDRETGRAADLHGQSSYQRATKGYSWGTGDRELYRRYFREAFEDAYDTERYSQARDRTTPYDNNVKQNRRGRSSDGYGNFGGSFQLRQTALNAGFNEGVKQGRTDRSKRNGGGYQNRKTYQSATKDYSSGLGARDVYQRYFREAYEHGYSDGYGTY